MFDPRRSPDGDGSAEPFPDFPIGGLDMAGMLLPADLLAPKLLGPDVAAAVDPREVPNCEPALLAEMTHLLEFAQDLVRQARPATPEASISSVLTAAVRVAPQRIENQDIAAVLLELRARSGDRVIVGALDGGLQAFRSLSSGALVRVAVSSDRKVFSIEPVYSPQAFASEFEAAIASVDTLPGEDTHSGALLNAVLRSYWEIRSPEDPTIDPTMFCRKRVVQDPTSSEPAYKVVYTSAGMHVVFGLQLDPRGALKLSVGHLAR